MNKNQNTILFFCIALLVFGFAAFTSCTNTKPTQTGSYKMLYDYQSSSLHPEFVLYHFSYDSSTVYFRIKSSELLYTRATVESPFLAILKMKTFTFNDAGDVADTTSLIIVDYAREKDGWLLGEFNIALSSNSKNIAVECTDIKKNITVQNFIRSEKLNTLSAQNYLYVDAHSEEPIFGAIANENQVVKVISKRNRNNNTKFYVGQYLGEMKLPPPPFSTTNPEIPDFTKSISDIFETDSTGDHFFLANEGLYFTTFDPEKKLGALLISTNEYYPEIKAIDQLPFALRYITTKVEYENIRDNYYPKKEIDNFWLECAGNKDHARELIRIYYNRVQEANYFFTNYAQGWRTDRGMIHIVFGNPSRIIKQQTYETWVYGEEGGATTLTFVFKKHESLNDQNIYVLNRDPAFKQYWEKQVVAWRNGRIYNE